MFCLIITIESVIGLKEELQLKVELMTKELRLKLELFVIKIVIKVIIAQQMKL